MTNKETTCVTELPCNGTACFAGADIDDQMQQILNGGNPHRLSKGAVTNWLRRKNDTTLPLCLQAAALKRKIEKAEQDANMFFSK